MSSIVGAVTEGTQQLRTFLQQSKKIIITTVQKFPFILEEIGNGHRGRKKELRRHVGSHDHAIRKKAEVMIHHFHEQVMAHRKTGGAARVMVVTSGIRRVIRYLHAFGKNLKE